MCWAACYVRIAGPGWPVQPVIGPAARGHGPWCAGAEVCTLLRVLQRRQVSWGRTARLDSARVAGSARLPRTTGGVVHRAPGSNARCLQLAGVATVHVPLAIPYSAWKAATRRRTGRAPAGRRGGLRGWGRRRGAAPCASAPRAPAAARSAARLPRSRFLVRPRGNARELAHGIAGLTREDRRHRYVSAGRHTASMQAGAHRVFVPNTFAPPPSWCLVSARHGTEGWAGRSHAFSGGCEGASAIRSARTKCSRRGVPKGGNQRFPCGLRTTNAGAADLQRFSPLLHLTAVARGDPVRLGWHLRRLGDGRAQRPRSARTPLANRPQRLIHGSGSW
jgi:hypothetical protein